MSDVRIRVADLSCDDDCQRLTAMTDAYARDAMGSGGGLSDAARARLPQALSRHPGLFALLAELDGQPMGHALCVLGFSSFAAAPLHDLSVLPAARGQGWGASCCGKWSGRRANAAAPG